MKNLEQNIKKSYIKYLLTEGKPPVSVFLFMDSLGAEEEKFYEHYSSFKALEQEIWGEIAEKTLTKMKSEEVYQQYSVREKLLSFSFTLIETMKANRSYVVYSLDLKRGKIFDQSFMEIFKEKVKEFAAELVAEGNQTGEIVNRPLIGERYADAFWLQILGIIRYWVNDNSKNFEKTDEYIEKSLNLSFDLIGRNAIDTAFEFGKFLFQKK
jgi:hypothetical protein